jgi:hypothetical protein
MSQSSPNGTAIMGKPWADHGHEHHTAAPHATIERTVEQVLYKERTTGFEPATLTLAKKNEENRPPSPSQSPDVVPVRLFVRPARPLRPDRIPVYHRACPRNRSLKPSTEIDTIDGRRVRYEHLTPRALRRLTTVDTHCMIFA